MKPRNYRYTKHRFPDQTTMGKNKHLSDVEKATIEAHALQGMRHKDTEKIIGRKRSTFTKYLIRKTWRKSVINLVDH